MKFDWPTTEAILKDIQKEIPYKIACESNGVSHDTFLTWIKRGNEDLNKGLSTYYTRFLGSLRTVEKARISKYLDNIKDNEKGHKGAEWVLERSYWKYFSSKSIDIELSERLDKLEKNNRSKDEPENAEKEEVCQNEEGERS